MACLSCSSENQGSYQAEINIHFPGRENLTKPTVLVSPKILVCLDCGFSAIRIEKTELRLLAEGSRAPGDVA